MDENLGSENTDEKSFEIHENGIKEVDLNKEMKNSFLSYAMSVIVSRALPDARDGLKPVHRRILYGMNELGVTPDKPHKKSARIVGEVMGKYHPHGDSSIYYAMVRMAQDFNYRYPLVDGHGNFGSIDGDGAAAMRYTEARMSKIATELLKDLNKDTVDFTDNYDGSEKEPEVLPSGFPNILVNGAMGIAVGMATNIPPHNLREVIDGILALIKYPDQSIDDLMNYIKGPDFPTGGIIMGLSQIRKAYMTGSGSISVKAKCEIHENERGKNYIVVTEIPYQINKSKLIEKIAETVKNKQIEGISALEDHSSMKGMKIVIELKKEANPNVILNNLYRLTSLQSVFAVNNLALVDKQPRVLNLKEMLQQYIRHRVSVLTRKIKFELKKAKARAHIVEGLLIARAAIDEVIEVFKTAKDPDAAMKTLMKNFKLTEIQARAILVMQLQKITGLEVVKLKEEQEELLRSINDYTYTLKHKERKLEIITADLEEIKEKYGDERKTEILPAEDTEYEDEDLIPVEDVIITITEKGYVKRMTADTYKAQNRGGKGISGAKMTEDDFIERVLYTSSHDTLLFFTNFGKVYKLKALRLPSSSRYAKGLPIVNLIKFSENEHLAAVLSINVKTESEGYLFFATRRGLIKKTPIDKFKNIRKTGIKAINLNPGDELFAVSRTTGENEIIMGTSAGKAIRFTEADVRSMGRNASGVKGIELKGKEEVVGLAVLENPSDEIIIVTDKGYGKRTSIDAFRIQTRGGKGVKALNCTEKNGKMIALLTVSGDEDLLIITDKGMIIRTPMEQILTIGRDTQGVRLIMLNEGHTVANITTLPKEEETDDAYEDEYDLDIDEDADEKGENDA